ncbi:sensor histidine kinase [Pseudahrensia aquimaris]|uniref:histidine kinase n=1 Tax=Pseudahrensia aquimaris TaxID=744461 RepID=A0ABW3FAQ4_9HYPH
MPLDGYDSADKNIVERRHSGNAARYALRGKAKPQGEQAPEPSNFASELLQRHADIHTKFYVPLIALVSLLAWAAWEQLPLMQAGLWGLAALLVVALRFLSILRFKKLETLAGQERHWLLTFNGLQALTGLVLAAFLMSIPNSVESISVASALFATGMALIGGTVLTSYNLRFGVLITALPAATVLAVLMVMNKAPATTAMAGILIGTTIFCELLASKIRGMTIAQLHSEVVRDQLIVDLEAATAISDEARRRAEEANLAKSRFLATMSHELRTPLNAILGFSEVMSNEVMGPLNNDFYKEYVSDIHRSGSHLLKLINEILDLSRIEAGRYEMNEEPVSITDAVEEAKQMMKLKAKQKHIKINLQLQPALPDLKADARAIRQIVLNLLSNALKFTPDSGVVTIKVGWTAGGGQYVSIKDSGPGIPEDEIPVVLSSFGQGSIAIKSAEQGTGLGLPIVQALVHMHQGHFELKSKMREGTEVVASFPKSRVIAPMPANNMGIPHQPSGTPPFASNRQTVAAPPMVGVGGVTEKSA